MAVLITRERNIKDASVRLAPQGLNNCYDMADGEQLDAGLSHV